MTKEEQTAMANLAIAIVKVLHANPVPPPHAAQAMGLACRMMLTTNSGDGPIPEKRDEVIREHLTKWYAAGLTHIVMIVPDDGGPELREIHTIQ